MDKPMRISRDDGHSQLDLLSQDSLARGRLREGGQKRGRGGGEVSPGTGNGCHWPASNMGYSLL